MELDYTGKRPLSEIEALVARTRNENEPLSTTKSNGIIIHGDNFVGLVKLLDKFEDKIDLIYIDPPFNTHGTFFYDKSHVSTISQPVSSAIAYSDNLPLEEYFEFLRERLWIMRKLLSPNGTLYFHIDTKIGHYMKVLLDEIFGTENFMNDITRIKSNPKNFSRKAFGNQKDMLLVYAKHYGKNIFNDIRVPLSENEIKQRFTKQDKNGKYYTTVPCHAPGETKNGITGNYWHGQLPPKGRHWRSSPEELEKLNQKGLIEWSSNNVPRIKRYPDSSTGKKIQDCWLSFKDPQYPMYPTQKNDEMLDMIVRQSSNESSVVMDCFCGSGSFLKAGLNNNRFVIGIDKSDISISVISNAIKDKQITIIDL